MKFKVGDIVQSNYYSTTNNKEQAAISIGLVIRESQRYFWIHYYNAPPQFGNPVRRYSKSMEDCFIAIESNNQ